MPVLHHKLNTGPRAMVTKSSNPAAAHRGALHWERCTQEQPGRLDSKHVMWEQRKGRSDFYFRTLVGTVVKRHLIQIYWAITLVCKREAEWNNKWRRPLAIQVESFKVGRWSGWLVLIYYKGIFVLFESPSIGHVKQNGILVRQFIHYAHAHTNHSCQTNSKCIWRKYGMWCLLQKSFSF